MRKNSRQLVLDPYHQRPVSVIFSGQGVSSLFAGRPTDQKDVGRSATLVNSLKVNLLPKELDLAFGSVFVMSHYDMSRGASFGSHQSKKQERRV